MSLCTDWNPLRLAEVTRGRWIQEAAPVWSTASFAFERKFLRPGDMMIVTNPRDWGKNSASMTAWLPQIAEQGASGFIVKEGADLPDLPDTVPVLAVENTRKALTALARDNRERLHCPVAAVTGSVGKSSTREMLRHLLSKSGSVASTYANYNLVGGVELSLANTPLDSGFGVYEAAIGAANSLERSARLLRPDVAIITNLSPVHLAQHKSLEHVADQKSLLFRGLDPQTGTAVLNADMSCFDRCMANLDDLRIERRVTFGSSPSAAFRLIAYEGAPEGGVITLEHDGRQIRYSLPLPGRHMAMNSLAAVAAAAALGIDWKDAASALSDVAGLGGRMQVEEIEFEGRKFQLIDDAFNANPASNGAALDYLASIEPPPNGRRVAILADMLELGEESGHWHRVLAEQIAQSNIDLVFTAGPAIETTQKHLPEPKQGGHSASLPELWEAVTADLRDGDIVLVKGSHATRVSRISMKFRGEQADLGKVAAPSPRQAGTPAAGGTRQPRIGNPRASIVVDLADGRILDGQATTAQIYPASLVKVLTLHAVFEAVAQGRGTVKDIIPVSARAAGQPSRWALKQDEWLSVADAVSACAICSSNEAAVALAEWHSGSEHAFALYLTALARRIGANRTMVRNASGLHSPGQISTPRDLALIIRETLKLFPEQCRVFGETSFKYKGRVHPATNKLLDVLEGADGLKTGHTPRAGWNLALTATRGGRRLLAIVAGCRDERDRDETASAIVESAFARDTAATADPAQGRLGRSRDLHRPDTAVLELPPGEDRSLLFLGDTYFGEFYDADRRDRGQTHVAEKYGYQHSLKNFAPLLAASDAAIANFEATLTTAERSPLEGAKGWILPARIGPSLETLRAYNIDILGLANNHALDFGPERLAEMTSAIDDFDFVRFGGGAREAEAVRPAEIRLPVGAGTLRVLIFGAYQYTKRYDEDFHFYAQGEAPGIARLDAPSFIDAIASARAGDPAALIVVMPHWGANYKWASDRQRNLAGPVLEAGANLILGHGAHMAQEIERLRDRWVVYGIGNFVFNSNGEYKRREVPPISLAARLNIRRVADEWHILLYLYPFRCDNHGVNFQPRPVDVELFQRYIDRVTRNIPEFDLNWPFMKREQDRFGRYLMLQLGRIKLDRDSRPEAIVGM